MGGTANPVSGIQGRLAFGFVKHGGAKNIFQARTLLQRQRKAQHLWGTEASSDGLHSDEQGLSLVTNGVGNLSKYDSLRGLSEQSVYYLLHF